MKCQNCGGQIGINVEKCPYCNSVNHIAVKRKSQLNKLHKENVRLEKQLVAESGKEVFYKLHKRLNIMLIIAGMVVFGGISMWKNPPEILAGIKHQAMIDYYYTNGRYEDIYWYIKDNDINFNYDNCDIGDVWNDYQEVFYEFAKAHEYYINNGVYDKADVRKVICAVHFLWGDFKFCDLGESEMATVEEYKSEAIMILKGAFKMTTEEVNVLINRELADYDEIVAFSEKVWEAIDER